MRILQQALGWRASQQIMQKASMTVGGTATFSRTAAPTPQTTTIGGSGPVTAPQGPGGVGGGGAVGAERLARSQHGDAFIKDTGGTMMPPPMMDPMGARTTAGGGGTAMPSVGPGPIQTPGSVGPTAGPFNFTNNPGSNAFTRAFDSGPVGSMLMSGGLGGVANYGTGGEFFEGAALGAMGGFAARGLHSLARANAGSFNSMVGRSAGGGGMMAGLSKRMMESANKGVGMSTLQGRHMMMAGAGLSGAMFGGRRNHKRGFNSHRGNSF